MKSIDSWVHWHTVGRKVAAFGQDPNVIYTSHLNRHFWFGQSMQKQETWSYKQACEGILDIFENHLNVEVIIKFLTEKGSTFWVVFQILHGRFVRHMSRTNYFMVEICYYLTPHIAYKCRFIMIWWLDN